MLSRERLIRLFIESMFILLGALVLWLGVTGRIFFDRRAVPWMAVSVALLLWGLHAIYQPGKSRAREEDWTRGLFLTESVDLSGRFVTHGLPITQRILSAAYRMQFTRSLPPRI